MKSWFRYTRYLYWPGLFLFVMGLTAGLVAGNWSTVPLVLMGAGLLIVLAWLLSRGGDVKAVWGQRSTQEGANAAIATVAVLVIFLLANILANRYNQTFDLTENRIFTLAPQTQEVVQGLQQPVTVYLFDPLPNPQDRALLENFERQNPGQFSYRYVDPQAEPGITQQFGVQNFGEVYVQQGDRRQLVQTVTPEQRLTEPRLTNALVQLTSDRQPRVYFLQGHGERQLDAGQGGLSQVLQNLEGENFEALPLDLASNPEVPEDADVLVLAGPQRALLPEETAALDAYLETPRGLMVLVDPQTDPELDDLLDPWGVELGDRILFEPAAGRDGVVTVINQYGQHPITQNLGNGISFYPLALPLLITEAEGVQASPLLITGPETEAREVGADGTLLPVPEADPRGNYIVGAALTRAAEQAADEEAVDRETPPAETRLVVVGNSSFITDGLINQQLNRDVFLNSVTWLSQRENATLTIRAAEPTNRRILLSPQQRILLAVAAMGLLPALGFSLAIALWWWRR